MMDLAIRGGRVIDPVNKIDEIRDVAVRDGALVPLQGEARREIDAAGCIVVPGLIDLHMHLWPILHSARWRNWP